MQGYILDYMEKMVVEMEDKLTEMRSGDEEYQMAALGTSPPQEQQAVHSVLQTYTVPLAQVRKRSSTMDSTSQERGNIAGNVNDSGTACEGEGFGQ